MQPLRDDDPRTLGPFTLRGRLGAGGMGVVYLAATVDGTEVAVKTVPRGVGSDVRLRLQREAELLAKIDHPRIARFVDADAAADEPWLAMRYISGPSLADADLPLPPQQLRQLADGLAEALAALHRLGVTHRDVKPGNVIMTSHGAVLVDLGIAVTADAKGMTMVGTAVGSPAWMAPEQFAGDNAGPPADVWGWAAVLVYAASGREPFGSGTIAALAHRIMTQPADLTGLPDWLRGPVDFALTKRPELRPTALDLTRGGRARVRRVPPPARPAWSGPSTMQGPRPPAAGPQQRPPMQSGPQQPRPPMHSGPQQVRPPMHSAPQQLRPPKQQPPNQPPRGSGPTSGSNRSLIWVLVAAVLAAVVAITLAVVLTRGGTSSQADPSGSVGSTGSTSTPSGGGSATVTASDISIPMLQQDGLCADGCTITGRVAFTHPKWGKSTLVTTESSGGSNSTSDIAVIDSAGKNRWSLDVGPVETFAPISKPIDSTGHIFATYNDGRYDGVVVVGPTSDSVGMTDFSSVPLGTDSSNYRFYDAAVDTSSSPYQIITESNDCNPSCAGGTLSYTTYKWDGVAYTQS